MREPDWLGLWRELAEGFGRQAHGPRGDAWRERAPHFDRSVKVSRRADPLLDFILSRLSAESTVLDIGAGTGRWAIPLAKAVRKVTAVEPSPSMRDVLLANAQAAGLTNLEVLACSWQEAEVGPHDAAVCAHAMYTSPDLGGFVHKMEACAKGCYLAMRVPRPDGIIAELSLLIHGHRHDSPNFVVGYNALYSLGMCANVLMEPEVHLWTNESIEEALGRAKRHLRVENDRYDEAIREVLRRRLVLRDGVYHWPDTIRSALVWWVRET